MSKSEVYSWRLSPELKAALEREAKRESRPVSALLEDIVRRWLADNTSGEDQERQRQVRSTARACFGSLHSGQADRSERVRDIVRQKLS